MDSPQGELNLPNLTGALGNSAFRGCAKLTSVASLGSITSIGSSAFENCTQLASITFPGSIDSVAESAFNNTPWYNSQNNTAIYIDNVLYKCKGTIPSSLVIPNNVVSITSGAFRSITSLESLTIGSGVNSIEVGENIFFGCTNLATIVVDSNNAKYNSGNGSNAIIETATNTLVAGCKGTSIPNSVTKIANRAFGNNNGITSINLNNVSEIGDYAFSGDSNLITVSQGNLTKLAEGAFNGCRNLQTIDISNVTTFGSGVFLNCSALNNVTLSSSLSTIPSALFKGCSSLTSITIPNSITSISEQCFENCTQLANVVIPNTVTEIKAFAFARTGFTSVTVPSGVTKIEVSAWRYCNNLTSVTISDTVTFIDTCAFCECPNLRTVVIGSGVQTIGLNVFGPSTALSSLTCKALTPPTLTRYDSIPQNTTYPIYVPAGSVDAYKAANIWNNHASQIQAIPTT